MSHTARYAAARAIATVAARFPDTPLIEPNVAALSPADTRLATAVFRTTLQRWLTLEHLLGRFSKQPVERMTAEVRAALLTGAAQLVFMDRLPGYAVVDEAVEIVKQLSQKRAAGMVNAVLRKLDGVVVERVDGMWEGGWEPAVDRLPSGDGGMITLSRPMLPKPDNLLVHLVVATSHPLALLQGWFKAYGRAEATRLALHSLQNPPTFVTGPGGSTVWGGGFDELATYLAEHPDERVQDPTAALAVASTADLSPTRILDLCAGRGTKTRQLKTLHPAAGVVAWDPADERRADLQAFAEQFPGVEVREPHVDERFDLIVLDVPCSNTGVLARRPAARYRFGPASVASLVALQRQIAERAMKHLAPGGRLLYSTCSIEAAENAEQAAWLRDRLGPGSTTGNETLTLPAGTGPTYHDGGYHAVLAVSR